MKKVLLLDDARASLLALILRNFISELAARGDPAIDAKLQSLRGVVEIRADRMAVVVRFGDAVEIRSAQGDERVDTVLKGEMAALVQFLAHKRFVGALLAGKLGFSGRPLLALKLFQLFLKA